MVAARSDGSPIFGSQFGPQYGPHFGKWPPEGPGPIWAPGHLKCQSKTVLERPFGGAPQNQGPQFGPHFWIPFWTPCWTPYLDPIVGPHCWLLFWTPCDNIHTSAERITCIRSAPEDIKCFRRSQLHAYLRETHDTKSKRRLLFKILCSTYASMHSGLCK